MEAISLGGPGLLALLNVFNKGVGESGQKRYKLLVIKEVTRM